MVSVGIEAMNVFGGTAYLDVMQLAQHHNLDTTRFENLLMVVTAKGQELLRRFRIEEHLDTGINCPWKNMTCCSWAAVP